MRLHLYEFRHRDFDKEGVDRSMLIVYVISSLSPRRACNYSAWDSGDVPPKIFAETLEQGAWREIHSKNDLVEINDLGLFYSGYLNSVLDIIPYCTDEPVKHDELGGDFLYLDCSIAGFLERYYGKEW